MTTIPTSPLQIPLSFAGGHGDPAAAWDDRELVDAWDAAAEEWKVSFHLVQTMTSSTHGPRVAWDEVLFDSAALRFTDRSIIAHDPTLT
jgi:hypothetical protein